MTREGDDGAVLPPTTYPRQQASVPVQPHAKVPQETAPMARHNEDLKEQWVEYAKQLLMHTNKARSSANVVDTQLSTLHLSCGFFNLGKLARQDHPGGTTVKAKVAAGTNCTQLIRLVTETTVM